MEKVKQLAEDELRAIDYELNELIYAEEEIYKELNRFLSSPSKRIRSMLVVLYLKTCGIKIDENILNLLVAGELIHNASLLHDDVIDCEKIRRGQTTIGVKFSPHVSILSGDFLLSLATEKLLLLQNWEVISIFWECTKKMSQAELKQYFLRGQIPKLEEYIEIAEGKTAGLFMAMLTGAAVLCGVDKSAAGRFARIFGILFQLKNDSEPNSEKADIKNSVFTAKDILGIEKTCSLKDNYLRDLRREVDRLPNNVYRHGLEDLLRLYD